MANQNNLQLILDQPLYSKVDLTTQAEARFFTTAGINATTNIDQPYVIDMNAVFTLYRLEIGFMNTTGVGLQTSSLDLVGKIAKECWLEFYLNTSQRIFTLSVSSLLSAPMYTAAAGASAYDPVHVLNGGTALNEPVVIRGGQNINFSLKRTTTTDYTGITAELKLFGIIDRTQTVQRGG